MLFVGGAEEISVRAIIGRVTDNFVELRKEVDRILRHLNVYRRGELCAHAAHTLARRAFALVRFAFEHEHVSATLLREMISDTRSHDAAADDDHVCGFHLEIKSKKEKEKSKDANVLLLIPRRRSETLRQNAFDAGSPHVLIENGKPSYVFFATGETINGKKYTRNMVIPLKS
jgi:hypothetical protein